MSKQPFPNNQLSALQTATTPRLWLINAYRAGELSQMRALAEALGWPWEEKQLVYRKGAFRTNLLRGSDLSGIDLSHSAPLNAPWPDLLISAGMRNEPVCRWIRNQSGGKTRIVHLGRPWADPEQFDLVITTPQYRLPLRPNVLQNTLPLHRINARLLRDTRAQWSGQLAQLPKPLIAVIVGGDSGPYALGIKAARRLARQACELAKAKGGSLLITTSARTRPAVSHCLKAIADTPMAFYQWRADDSNNPYLGYLAMADELIVTADSVSMLSEACATGKPLHMFDLGTGKYSMRGESDRSGGGNDFSLSALAYRALMRWGWQRLSRDITLIHRQLEQSGRVCWLGAATPAALDTDDSDRQRAVSRVRELMGLAG
ncbi:mitochondrial fission ELM1 family protein [Porticoccus sp.]